MSSNSNLTLRVNCSAISFSQLISDHTTEVVGELKEALEKKLLKMGIIVSWSEKSDSCELVVQVTQINSGDQIFRRLFLFGAQAALETEGRIVVAGNPPQSFRHVVKANEVIKFGSSIDELLRECAQSMSEKIVCDVLLALQADEKRKHKGP